MKNLFTALGAFCRPAFFVGAALCLVLSFLLGLFYTPVVPDPPASFEEEREALTAALANARAQYDRQIGTENENAARKTVLFYENALRFSLPVWENDFYSESVSLLTELQAEWEILLDLAADSPRAGELQTEIEALEKILTERDPNAYLALWEARLRQSGALSEEEVQDRVRRAFLRLAASSSQNGRAAAAALTGEIALLQESVASGVDHYHAYADGRMLSAEEKELLEQLLACRQAALDADAFDPVPANTETLGFVRRVSLFLAQLFLCFYLPRVFRRLPVGERRRLPFVLIVLYASFCLAILFVTYASVSLFCPLTRQTAFVWLFDAVRPIPFFRALAGSVFTDAAGGLFFLSLELILLTVFRKKTLCAFLSLSLSLVWTASSLVARFLLAPSSVLSFLPLWFFNAAMAFFAESPRYLPSFSPAVSLIAVFLSVILLLWYRARLSAKETGLTPPAKSDTTQTSAGNDAVKSESTPPEQTAT